MKIPVKIYQQSFAQTVIRVNAVQNIHYTCLSAMASDKHAFIVVWSLQCLWLVSISGKEVPLCFFLS